MIIRDYKTTDFVSYGQFMRSGARNLAERQSINHFLDDLELDRRKGTLGIVVAEDAGNIVGYCNYGPFSFWQEGHELLQRHPFAQAAYLAGIEVDPIFRGQGIGEEMTRRALTAMPREPYAPDGVVSFVEGNNDASHTLLQRVGLRPVDVFYRNDEKQGETPREVCFAYYARFLH